MSPELLLEDVVRMGGAQLPMHAQQLAVISSSC
jgi:hypothetical protein